MKRVLFVILITCVGIIASFVDAFYGLLLYNWYSFSSPLELTFGQLENTRLSLIVGAVVALTTFHQRRQIVVKHRITLLAVFFVFVCFCSLAAQSRFSVGYILSELELLVKILIMCLIVPVLVTSVSRLRIFILVIAISAGFLGAYYGVFGLFAGSRAIYGPGRIGDNNGYAVFLASLLPFIFYGGRHFPLRMPDWLRGMITCGLLAANCLALVLTYSRGGFLAGSTVLLLLATRLRSRGARVFGWLIFVPFAAFSIWNVLKVDPNLWRIPQETAKESIVMTTIDGYLERLSTLRLNVRDEESAGSRMHFWKVALRMVEANPALGVGLNRYSHEYSNYDFLEGKFGRVRAVHNTLLSVLSETGFLGFGCFVGMILVALWIQVQSRRRFREIEDPDVVNELSDYISMVRISLAGFLVGGTFVTTTYQEIFWALISISIAIELITLSIVEQE